MTKLYLLPDNLLENSFLESSASKRNKRYLSTYEIDIITNMLEMKLDWASHNEPDTLVNVELTNPILMAWLDIYSLLLDIKEHDVL